jgi:hypothetical protein
VTGDFFHAALASVSGSVSVVLLALIALRPDYWVGAEGLPRMLWNIARAVWTGQDTSRETRLGLHWTCATSGAGAQAVCALGALLMVERVQAGAVVLLWGWSWTGCVLAGWGLAAYLAGGHRGAHT